MTSTSKVQVTPARQGSDPGMFAASMPAYSTWSGESSPVESTSVIADDERYERVSLLGEGGMGRVYLGYDRRLNRTVAIKQPLGDPDGPAARMLRHEASLTARLSHPGIVVVYDIVHDADGPLFVMERVDGESLRKRLLDAGDSAEARTRLLRPLLDACNAVGHAHSCGIAHLDISPNNILIGSDGHVWVVDWGLARPVDDGALAHDLSPMAGSGPIGTPGFMAPEVSANGSVGVRADVWSLGAILHRIVYGVAAEVGVPSNARVSPDLASIVRQALESDPMRRYPDARSLALDLERWLDGRRVEAYQFPTWRLAGRLLRQWRVPIAISLVSIVLLIAALVSGAQRAHRAELVALAAQSRAEEQAALVRLGIAEQLTARAQDALNRADADEARSLAEQAIAQHDLSAAHGVLALAGAMPSLTLLATAQLPDCMQWLPIAPWPDGLCLRAESIALYRDGEALWEVPAELPAAARAARWPLADPLADDAFFIRNGRNELVVHSAASGELLHTDLRGGNFVDVYDSMQAVLATRAERFGNFELAGCPGVIETAIRLRDGSTLATCGVGGAEQRQVDGTVVKWPFFAGEGISVLAELSDGSVWVGSTSGRVAPLDATRPGYDHGEPVRALRPIGESLWLVVAGARGTVRVIDIDSARALLTIPGRHVWVDVVDGSEQNDVAELISVSSDHTTRYALPRAIRRAQFAGEHGLASIVWAADGSGVYVTDGGGAVVWVPIDAQEPTQRHVFVAGVAKWVSAAPDSGLVWATGIDANAIFRVSTDDAGAIRTSRDFDAEVSMRRVGALRDGVVVWLDYGLGIVVGALAGGTSERLGIEAGFRDLGTSSDGRCVVAVGDVVRRGCLADAASRARPAEALQWHELASRSYVAGDVNQAGSVLVAARERVDVYTTPEVDGVEPEYSWVHPRGLVDVAWVGDDRVATGDLDGRIRVFRTDGSLLAEWLPHTARIGAIAVSRDARWIASAGWDGAIRFADMSAIGSNDRSDQARADSLLLLGSPE